MDGFNLYKLSMKQIVSHLTDGNDGNKREIVRNPSSLAEFGYHPWFGQAFYMAADAPVNFSRPLVLLPEKTMSIEFHRKLVWHTCILLIFIILNLPWVIITPVLNILLILNVQFKHFLDFCWPRALPNGHQLAMTEPHEAPRDHSHQRAFLGGDDIGHSPGRIDVGDKLLWG